MMIRRLGLLILLVSLGLSFLPTSAQGVVDSALLQRAFNAAQALDGYSSYVREEQVTEFEQRTIKTNGQVAAQTVTNKITNSSTTIIRGQNRAALYKANMTLMQGASVFSLTGELRYVNNILYALVTNVVGSPNGVAYPNTWSVIGDPVNAAGIFAVLRPQDVVYELGVLDDKNPLDTFTNFQSVVVSVVEVTGIAPNGSPAQVLTVQFDRRLYDLLFANTPIISKISNQSTGSYKFYLDSTGTIIAAETFFRLELVGIDSTLDSSLGVGQTADIVNIENRITTIKNINDPQLTVQVPQ